MSVPFCTVSRTYVLHVPLLQPVDNLIPTGAVPCFSSPAGTQDGYSTAVPFDVLQIVPIVASRLFQALPAQRIEP